MCVAIESVTSNWRSGSCGATGRGAPPRNTSTNVPTLAKPVAEQSAVGLLRQV